MDLPSIPILALYEKDYWPNKLSTMIRGLSIESAGEFTLAEYENLDELKQALTKFVISINGSSRY